MSANSLPHGSEDVLALPAGQIPDTISALVRKREFSSLVCRIHREIRSPDPALRAKGTEALQRLGFPE
ncbi:hypothetical protein [Salipiger abyssi]|uniref:Uncharacterized protein n=1 Tax=Salipiger abyssi TaxID=1250539 RepID=A0A1P8UVS2_9RHOB|nr:hypothetical protein [Salipiger abyssi]APZ53480.1 hypothetical protein Ga0080574_TMP3146 [Salipiger abyssi]MBN9889162.1 hypothetical protein [Salipiger abyssi]